jgi:hypothetical protein
MPQGAQEIAFPAKTSGGRGKATGFPRPPIFLEGTANANQTKL